MFTRLAPQKVQHSSGYIVQVAGRESVEYIEPDRKTMVNVDFSRTVGVWASTLREWHTSDGKTEMSPAEQSEVLKRIVLGLEAMGSTVEVC
jgi:hypothetical protein